VNTYIFFDPHFRPLDLSGVIMPGAYLNFLDSETDTPTPVYADAALITSLGTTVTSDGDGRFAVMYMDPEVTYRVQLYNALNVLQWDVDPYTPPRDYPPGSVMLFYGDATARDAAYPPALWQVLDGNNGTPDGRDRVLMIAGGSYVAGDTGGATVAATEPAGGHAHGGTTGSTVLTADNMPEHHHRLYVRQSSTLRGNTRGFGFSGTAGLEGQIIDDAPYGYEDDAPQSGSNTLVEDTGSADPDGHNHTITAALDHTHDITGGGLPPFIALWALMRRS
jgi:hypothetical protein